MIGLTINQLLDRLQSIHHFLMLSVFAFFVASSPLLEVELLQFLVRAKESFNRIERLSTIAPQ